MTDSDSFEDEEIRPYQICSFPSWLLGDHLGSTSMVADAGGAVVNELRYSAFGETRYQNGTLTTDYLFTGQRQEVEIGLYYYVARWYDPAIGRFIQADSIVPNPASAKGFDRYAYGFNNPLIYLDPSGHIPILLDGQQLAEKDKSLGIVNHISDTKNRVTRKWKSPVDRWRFSMPKPPKGITSDIEISSDQFSPEVLFANTMGDPLHNPNGGYSGFGGCNTITGSCSSHHPGTDVGPSSGTNIYSVGHGQVVQVGSMNPGLGEYVVIRHLVNGQALYSVYAHLSVDSVSVSEGDIVGKNSKLGVMGNSGTGDIHLHFEVRKAGRVGSSSSGFSFQGAGIHTAAPSDAYWAYSPQELGRYWVDLSITSWIDKDPNYNTWPGD